MRPDLEDKLTRVIGTLNDNEDTKVVLVVGLDTPDKDEFCARLLEQMMMLRRKTGRWILPPRQPSDIPEIKAGITVLTAIDLYSTFSAKAIAVDIRSDLNRGRSFILCGRTKESYGSVLGEELMDYVNHHAIRVTVDTPTQNVYEVE